MTEAASTATPKPWYRLEMNGPVFIISAILIVLFSVSGIVFQSSVDNLFGQIQAAIANYGGWFYVLTMNVILGFVVYVLFSRFGKIRLGGPNAVPEFSTFGWFTMLFSAGMGIGLLFYAVAEPLYHFVVPPIDEPGSVQAAKDAMGITFLHWGFHPWAVYTMVALALAYFSFNRGYPLTIRTVFYPLLGDRIHGWMGHTIDILAVVATLFGVATSLGLGVQQVNAGLNHLFGLPQTGIVQMLLIAGITGIATVSVVMGLDGGIRRLSELNIVLAAVLLVFVLVLGPTLFIFNGLIENIGHYLQNFAGLATWNETYTATSWQNAWTVFYWGWWIAWSPFVGMFIARVSKGRSIREFVLGVMLVPVAVTFCWLTIFGDGALYIEMFGAGGMAKAVQENIPVSLFVFLENFPLSFFTSILAVVVVVTFFVTSSDSGSLVIDIITAGGSLEPPVIQRIFWAVLEGVVAAALLVGGGLVALQTAAITTGLPFAIVLLFMCWSLNRAFHQDAPEPIETRAAEAPVAQPAAAD